MADIHGRRGNVVVVLLIAVAAVFLFLPTRTVKIAPSGALPGPAAPSSSSSNVVPTSPEVSPPTSTAKTTVGTISDLENQPPLPNPPTVVRGIYLTNWTAGSPKRLAALIALTERTELNAMVIDIKDYSGYVAYTTGIPEVAASGAEGEIRILRPNALLKDLHDKGIYVIGRVSVFQDPVLSAAHPEWAVKDKRNGKLWADRKGITWLDAAAQPVWDYHIAIARDAFARGFDEVNFDYIRFPSDGALENTEYTFWDEKSSQHSVIAKFFRYLRNELPDVKISADLFGLTTSAGDDLGIGQIIEDAYETFDYVSPMVYPSHFAAGYNGFKNPAEHPYDVIKVSMEAALAKLTAYSRRQIANSTTSTSSSEPLALSHEPLARLRPWLQAFDLGAVYDEEKIQAQIQAAEDVLGPSGRYAGWLLWDPSNNYRHYQ